MLKMFMLLLLPSPHSLNPRSPALLRCGCRGARPPQAGRCRPFQVLKYSPARLAQSIPWFAPPGRRRSVRCGCCWCCARHSAPKRASPRREIAGVCPLARARASACRRWSRCGHDCVCRTLDEDGRVGHLGRVEARGRRVQPHLAAAAEFKQHHDRQRHCHCLCVSSLSTVAHAQRERSANHTMVCAPRGGTAPVLRQIKVRAHAEKKISLAVLAEGEALPPDDFFASSRTREKGKAGEATTDHSKQHAQAVVNVITAQPGPRSWWYSRRRYSDARYRKAAPGRGVAP